MKCPASRRRTDSDRPAVEELAEIKPAGPAGDVGIAHDVDRAAVLEQVIELGPLREFVNPLQVDQEEVACPLGGRLDAVEIDLLIAIVGAHAHEVAFITDNVDQLELLEERRNRREAFAQLWLCFDRDTNRRRVVEAKTHKRVSDRSYAPVRDKEV